MAVEKYKIALLHDQLLINMTFVDPQPRSQGVQYGRRTVAVDGSVHDENPYIDLRWSLFKNPTTYNSLLTTFGLAVATSAEVTIYVPNEFYILTRYNGTAVRPPGGSWRDYRIRDVTIRVKDLEVIA